MASGVRNDLRKHNKRRILFYVGQILVRCHTGINCLFVFRNVYCVDGIGVKEEKEMIREDILRMASEADREGETTIVGHQWLERFAALVAAAERERIKEANAPEIEKINAHIKALEEAVLAERERIAEWVEDMCADLDAQTIANGIRNNGNDDMRAFEVRK